MVRISNNAKQNKSACGGNRSILYGLSVLVIILCLFILNSLNTSKATTSTEKALDAQKLLRAKPLPPKVQKSEKVVNDAVSPGKGNTIVKVTLSNLDGIEGATGDFFLSIQPSLAPKGAERFLVCIDFSMGISRFIILFSDHANKLIELHLSTILKELVRGGFYNDCRFFRVLPNFVAQLGINGDPEIQKRWRKKTITDDPILPSSESSNKRGTITFATSGKNTRTTQLFINKKDNKYLDKEGFAPFGEVMDDGMKIVDRIFSEYKERPSQGKIQLMGNAYLEKEFPKLTFVKSMTLVE